MPTVSESDLIPEDVSLCSDCGVNEGAIWLCGEGALCESCFSDAAGIEEAQAFDNPDESTRAKAKAGMVARREREGWAQAD